ncbi:hypothetical protein BDW22DRAFT_625944 [Trametopsis cervina]|nr:hypothetical protein BDW22DRAFT_625944 [Trametopsis cervina]
MMAIEHHVTQLAVNLWNSGVSCEQPLTVVSINIRACLDLRILASLCTSPQKMARESLAHWSATSTYLHRIPTARCRSPHPPAALRMTASKVREGGRFAAVTYCPLLSGQVAEGSHSTRGRDSFTNAFAPLSQRRRMSLERASSVQRILSLQ